MEKTILIEGTIKRSLTGKLTTHEQKVDEFDTRIWLIANALHGV